MDLDGLLAKLTELQQHAMGDAHSHRRQPIDDSFSRLTKRVAIERVLRTEGMSNGEPPEVSPRYRPTRGK